MKQLTKERLDEIRRVAYSGKSGTPNADKREQDLLEHIAFLDRKIDAQRNALRIADKLKEVIREFLNTSHMHIWYYLKDYHETVCTLCGASVVDNADDEDYDEMMLRFKHHVSCPLEIGKKLLESKSTPKE